MFMANVTEPLKALKLALGLFLRRHINCLQYALIFKRKFALVILKFLIDNEMQKKFRTVLKVQSVNPLFFVF